MLNLVPRKRRRFSSEPGPLAAFFVAIGLLLAVVRDVAAETPVPPAPDRYVTDATASTVGASGGFISEGARAELEAELRDYERQTGHQVVVWIGDTVGETPLDDFAVRTFKAWRIGQQGKDDGVLVLVLARDRKIDIEVGYGLEGALPDAAAKRIIDDVMVPRLRAGDADGAVLEGLHAVLAKIEGKPFVSRSDRPPDSRGTRPGTGQLIFFGLLAVAFLVLFVTNPALAIQLLFMIGSGRGGGRGGFGGGGGFTGGGGRSGGGGARGSW
ncbi:MAG TPA: TPM domain-containing protein [Polyangiaceae bacterium]|nr:TPM domain-containing protein [Polyangiaceae bacterium]